jgi:hypothetical protein
MLPPWCDSILLQSFGASYIQLYLIRASYFYRIDNIT